MAGKSQVSLIVGFPKAQNSHKIGALHRKFKVRQDEKLQLINGYSVDMPADKVDSYLESLPTSASVMVDRPLFEKPKAGANRGSEFSDAEGFNETPYFSRPEGLKELHEQGIQGQGSTIAVIDSGLAKHGDFKNRIKFFKDFSNKQTKNAIDPLGHGTHVAGIAAGDGKEIDGIAPQAELVGLRIKTPLQAIKAIEWAVANKDKYSIDVLNLSLGVEANLPNKQDPFAQAAQQAVDAGLITVVASGNECFSTHCEGSISTPGILPAAITVGAYDDGGTPSLDDDRMWGRSSNGPTAHDQVAKPDLVALGVNVFAPSSAGSSMGKTRPRWEKYHSDQGSSMATPMVSGSAALLLQVDPTLTQQELKDLLMSTADPLEKADANAQGAGRLNLAEAVRRLRSEQQDVEVQFDTDRNAS
jgi:subtilisin family serine protease